MRASKVYHNISITPQLYALQENGPTDREFGTRLYCSSGRKWLRREESQADTVETKDKLPQIVTEHLIRQKQPYLSGLTSNMGSERQRLR